MYNMKKVTLFATGIIMMSCAQQQQQKLTFLKPQRWIL